MKIIVNPTNSLGNRLTCVSSCFALSELSGRDFEIMWTTPWQCGIDFLDLFEEQPFDYKELDYNKASVSKDWAAKNKKHLKVRSEKELSRAERDEKNIFHTTSPEGKKRTYLTDRFAAAGEWILNSTIEELVVLGGGVVRPSCISHTEFLKKRQEFYRQLRVRQELQDLADSFLAPYEGKSILGVHIRGTDFAKMFSKYKTPESIYKQARKAFGPYLSSYDNVYVTSEDINILNIALADIPNSISTLTDWPTKKDGSKDINEYGTTGRGDKDKMLYAFISWLILSSCDCVMHNFKSTFAREAALYGDKKTIPYNFSGECV